MKPSTRHNIYVPDELWAEVVRAAAREALGTGKTVSVAEWVREACRQRLERDRED